MVLYPTKVGRVFFETLQNKKKKRRLLFLLQALTEKLIFFLFYFSFFSPQSFVLSTLIPIFRKKGKMVYIELREFFYFTFSENLFVLVLNTRG